MDNTGNTTVLMLGVAGMGLSIAMFLDALKMKQPTTQEQPVIEQAPPQVTAVSDAPEDPVQEPLVTPVQPVDEPSDVNEEPVVEEKQPVEEPSDVNEDPVVITKSDVPPVEQKLDTIDERSTESSSRGTPSFHAKSGKASNGSRRSVSSAPQFESRAEDSISEPPRVPPPVPPNSPRSDTSSNRERKHKKKHRKSKRYEEMNGQDMTAEERVSYRQFYQDKRDKIIREYNSKQPDNSYYGDGSPWSKRMYFIKEAYRRSREKTPVKVPYNNS